MIAIQEIVRFLAIENNVSVSGNVTSMKQISDQSFCATDLGWCSDKNIAELNKLNAGFVIVNKSLLAEVQTINPELIYLPVEQPRSAFSAVLMEFFVPKTVYGQIHSSVLAHETAQYDAEKVNFGPNVVVEANCVIGDYVEIGANTVVKSGTIIEDYCKLGCNNTIGGVGFGYEPNEQNQYELIPHIGIVHLAKFVEIGNNVCIDRAVLGSTYLAEHVKVDNLVHIAHGVKIGKNSLIIANSMIAGSVEIGENVWVSPSVAVRQKLAIGDNALVGLGAVVVKNVDDNQVVAGNPAKPLEKK